MYEEYETHLIFPTICHNEIGNDASMKLYYYYDNKIFRCYTECDSAFNIYELVRKVFALQGVKYGFYEVLQTIINILELNIDGFVGEKLEYEPIGQKYRKRKREVYLPVYNENVLGALTKYHSPEWVEEGITHETMDEFQIMYSYPKNKIIIPHYDVENHLVGIRGRALNQYELSQGNKYMPVQIENTLYTHPLSLNLYGLNKTCDNIRRANQVILFEGEKSVLKLNSCTSLNNSVATCGSTLNKIQLELVMKTCRPKEVIIAYDKEYETNFTASSTKYLEKLYDMAQKYTHYCDFSIIFDMRGLLDMKDSPIDKGYDVFTVLMQDRIKV